MSNEHLDLITFENLSDDLGATLGTSPLDTRAKLNRGSLRGNRIHNSNFMGLIDISGHVWGFFNFL